MMETTNKTLPPDFGNFIFGYTSHSEIRCQQRGIKNWAVEQILKHGERIYKQGRVFRFMKKKDIEKRYTPEQQKQLKNLMILVSDCNYVITAYRNDEAVSKVKRKSKRLGKNDSQIKEADSHLKYKRITSQSGMPSIAA